MCIKKYKKGNRYTVIGLNSESDCALQVIFIASLLY